MTARDLFAERRVRDADDRAVRDVGVLEDRRLDLDRVDVLAAADDHVLRAVDDVDEAVLVDARDVAGVQPALGEGLGRLLGPVPVPAHDVGPLYPQLADHVGTRGTVVGGSSPSKSSGTIATSFTGYGRAAAGRAWRRSRGPGSRQTAARRLGQPVAVARLAAGEGARRRFTSSGGAGAPRRRRSHARRVAAAKSGWSRICMRDRRHAAEARDPLALDQSQRLAGVEVVHHDDLAARGGAHDHDREASRRVKERDVDEHGVLHARCSARRSTRKRSAAAGGDEERGS